MRKTFIIALLLCSLLSFASPNNQSIKGQSNSSLSSQSELSKIIFRADTSILDNYNTELIDIIENIDYFDLLNYSNELEILFQLNLNKNLKNEKLSQLIFKQYAFTLYREKKYNEAINVFETYFKLFGQFKAKNNDFILERIKYADCYRQLRNDEEFLKLIHNSLDEYSQENDQTLKKSQFQLELGKYYLSRHKFDSARIYLSFARNSYHDSNKEDNYLLANIYRYLVRLELQDLQSSLAADYAEKALDYLLKTDPTDYELAIYYEQEALALFFNYQISSALDYFKMSARIYEQYIPGNSKLASVYRYIGWAYYQKEEYISAISFFNKSIAIQNDISNYYTYRQLADTYFALDSIDKAATYYSEVLAYLKNQNPKNEYQIAVTQIEYGRLLLEMTDEYEKGEMMLTEALKTYYQLYGKNNLNLLYPLNILGTHYLNRNETERGLDTLQSALKCSSNNFQPSSIYDNPDYSILDNNVNSNNTLAWKARGLYNKYLTTGNNQDLKSSLETYNFYLYCSSENRKYFDKSSSIVSSKQIHYVYNEAINVAYLMYRKTNDERYIDDIFRFTEGKKSFTLFQSLKILENKKLLKIPQNLIDLESKLKQEISLITEKLINEKRGDSNLIKIDSFENIAFQNHLKLDSIQSIFKNEYSGYYNLKYGFEEFNLQKIQDRIQKNNAFINYSISDSLLHSICFTRDTVCLKTQVIDSSFFFNIQKMVSLLSKVNTDNSYEEFNDFAKSSHFLYQKLIAPQYEQIKGLNLIIIPDDELNYISFDALIKDEIEADRPDYRKMDYLIKSFKVNVANSMQIYFNMKQRSRYPNEDVYAFAPSYSPDAWNDSLPKEYQNLRPLDYANFELESIAKSMHTVSFNGEEATKENFRKNAQYAGILHLAMHTIIDDEKPLQSKFLFTYENNLKSSMLNTYELLTYNLNAELAVLSGCSTGDGKLQKGEGVMSLSSGFQYAGVPAIVMSLWEVNDRFGSLVIHKFYENLAGGLDKKQALYKAKIEVLNQGNALYAHPYYWAGLTLIGDESKIDFISRYRWDLIVIVFAPLVFIFVVLFQSRKNG